jgi:hypothetical protein
MGRVVATTLTLIAALCWAARADQQLCVNGHDPPYCLCGAERQANDMLSGLIYTPNPPQTGTLIVQFGLAGIVLNYGLSATTPGSVPGINYSIYVNGVSKGTALIPFTGNPAFQPPLPWGAGTTPLRLTMEWDHIDDEFFFQYSFLDANSNELLCMRSQVFNQGVSTGRNFTGPICPPGIHCEPAVVTP